MIKIPILEEKDLEVFQNKKIVIYGYNSRTRMMYDTFLKLGFDVVGVCDNRGIVYSCAIIKQKMPFLSVNKLKIFAKKNINTFVQISDFRVVQDKDFLCEIGVQVSDWAGEMVLYSLDPIITFDALCHNPARLLNNLLNKKYARAPYTSPELYGHSLRNAKKMCIICNPSKTADVTIHNTINAVNGNKFNRTLLKLNKIDNRLFLQLLNKIVLPITGFNPKIDYVNLFHTPQGFCADVYKKEKTIKIITAVREPISQNLSDMFQAVGAGDRATQNEWLLHHLQTKDLDIEILISDYKREFIEHNDDFQRLFDLFMVYCNKMNCYEFHIGMIQNFMSKFVTHIVDLYDYPFDQEKGYAIIKSGNIEVFVYQLEKLNNVVPQLSEWIGVPFDKLEKGNVGEDKWIGESYKQAQKEIQITQEYFDRCFNEPYVKHFYSEADIEKFKARWRPHIV